jgi:phosphoenolpyruvate synthase/pyruvate phosphate dikinase
MTAGATPPLIVSLDDDRALDPQVAGRKAATLARLRAAGFPVPDGFVVTVDGVSRIPPSGGHVPDDVRAALASALDAHGDGELAVRSSGIAEDLAGASFAGQYETVLGVRGLDEVVDAVSRCRDSASSERATAYRAETGAGDAAWPSSSRTSSPPTPPASRLPRILSPATQTAGATVRDI